MKPIFRSLFAAVAVAAIFIPSLPAQTSSNQPAPAQLADAMRRMAPNYPVPYGLATVESVTEVLNRIRAYLDANTAARIINSQTRAEITDFSTPDPKAIVERGAFPIISYEWGVTYSGHAATRRKPPATRASRITLRNGCNSSWTGRRIFGRWRKAA